MDTQNTCLILLIVIGGSIAIYSKVTGLIHDSEMRKLVDRFENGPWDTLFVNLAARYANKAEKIEIVNKFINDYTNSEMQPSFLLTAVRILGTERDYIRAQQVIGAEALSPDPLLGLIAFDHLTKHDD